MKKSVTTVMLLCSLATAQLFPDGGGIISGTDVPDTREYKEPVYILETGMYLCLATKSDREFSIDYKDLFIIRGHFDIKTGRITSVNYLVTDRARMLPEDRCTVRPEWGERYVDKNCVNSFVNVLEKFVRQKFIPKIKETSVYRQCEIINPEDG